MCVKLKAVHCLNIVQRSFDSVHLLLQIKLDAINLLKFMNIFDQKIPHEEFCLRRNTSNAKKTLPIHILYSLKYLASAP